jgi:hypothetical protein
LAQTSLATDGSGNVKSASKSVQRFKNAAVILQGYSAPLCYGNGLGVGEREGTNEVDGLPPHLVSEPQEFYMSAIWVWQIFIVLREIFFCFRKMSIQRGQIFSRKKEQDDGTSQEDAYN